MDDAAEPATADRSRWIVPIVVAVIAAVATVLAAVVLALLDEDPAPPPTPQPPAIGMISVEVRNGSSAHLRGADLDSPRGRNEDAEGVADLILGTEDFTVHFPAGFAALGGAAGVGYQECASIHSWLTGFSMEGMTEGLAFCVRTTEQHLALVRVSGLYNRRDETRFTVTGTVWD
jgi:hypothetical protein